MKTFAKFLVTLVVLYAMFWAVVAVYFNFAGQYKESLESSLSSLFERAVTIEQLTTGWNDLSPTVQIKGFRVSGDTEDQPALAFTSLSAQFSPFSILQLWPRLTEFALEQPNLEIVSLPDNQLQVAGLKIGSNRSSGIHPKRLISWLLDHESVVWLDGEIVWRRLNGESLHYQDTSFVYQRRGDNRQLSAATRTPKGPFAFRAQTNGNVLEVEDWDASFEVLGSRGQSLLAPEDLSLAVEDGNGSLHLKTLDIQRIQDFLLITGLGEAATWVLDSQLSGRLHDVRFDFSGPLLEFEEWSLSALASEVNFIATPSTPGMSNLAGAVSASANGGTFKFTANNAFFDWPARYDSRIPIDRAEGQFHWAARDNGEMQITLENGVFEDQIARIWDLNASCNIDKKSRNVSNLARLFTVDSVADLSFQNGRVVENKAVNRTAIRPLFLDTSARFEIKSLPDIVRYFPNDPRIDKFRTWWSKGFREGSATGGTLSYRGEISKNAIKVGKAQLSGQADFQGVELDYGYQRDWPRLLNANGRATLENELLTIIPDQGWLEEDPVFDAKVSIDSLFDRERQLQLQASMVTPLARVMDFLFDGPLLKPEQRGKPMPVTAQSGQVSAQVKVSIPLRRIRETRVSGTALITDGHLLLPQGVPVTDISTQINFTERSVEAEIIKAAFLGGNASAKLITTKAAQPPELKISASGNADIKLLQPWVGDHILSWLDGRSDWQGAVAIAGPRVEITAASDLQGVTVSAPPPLAKSAEQISSFSLFMQAGSKAVQKNLTFEYGANLRARFAGNRGPQNKLFDNSIIWLGEEIDPGPLTTQPGVNFLVDYNQLDLDGWLSAVIELARLKTAKSLEPDTAFLDAMRSVKIMANDPLLFNRQFGALNLSALSVDGRYWIGSINGDNINGTLQAEPRAQLSKYRLNLSRLDVVEAQKPLLPPNPVNVTLQPQKYPAVEIQANIFRMADKSLGRLELAGAPDGEVWKLSKLEISDHGIRTAVQGQWANSAESGSASNFQIETTIDEAGEVLDEMEFNDIIKKGRGALQANISWIGAPHEFDFSRLNGDFNLRISDGELVKVATGSGRLLGLFNFNAIARRLTLDFRDLFSSGLQFDRMQYSGILANGQALLREAFILTPSVFVQMEGKVDLGKELIDMEIHASPQLGGNLTLLSALANPAAGAVVFLTQQLFKDQMRSSGFKNYRALGSWDDFELVEFDSGSTPSNNPTASPEPLGSMIPNDQEVDASVTNPAANIISVPDFSGLPEPESVPDTRPAEASETQ